MADYVSAKTNLFSHQKKDDIAVYFAGNKLSQQIAGNSPGIKIPYFAPPGAVAKDEGVIVVGDPEVKIIDTDDVKLIGEHNLENICAAITTVWQISPDVEAISRVLNSFSGLEHRLEFVGEIDDVRYFDDSFGTTPDTAIVALRAFVEPKVLILGGHDKGLPVDDLVDEIIRQRVRKVIAIGDTGEKIAEVLASKGYKDVVIGLSTMPEIVAAARKSAEAGDVVLLSTGTSSFGLFRDYKDRGEQFKAAVEQLE
jgi:UDP-N-acetylmuramoylalanine--D-glutamate ligase